jgi:ubiquinone/menaquinone biosynthesis C-methylase UbiE
MSIVDQASYLMRQGARVAWYMGHYLATQDFRRAQDERDPRLPKIKSALPSRPAVLRRILALFSRDMENAKAGLYPFPRDHEGTPAELMRRSRRFFADVPKAAERRAARRGTEVYDPALTEKYPAYFLQNFHYQTDGYLTKESAEIYDMQVEVLFSGTANAMRRQCLVPMAHWLRERGGQRGIKLLDVGCGTGRLVRLVLEAFPKLEVTGTDMSQAYLDEAREHVAPYGAQWLAAPAEALPLPDASFDIVSSVYLFHEVPPMVRREIVQTFARVLKPGGLLVFMDSLQPGDDSDFDGLLDRFPIGFHEPYYPGYLREDLPNLFAQAGLEVISTEPIFLSKLVVARKPA